MAKVTAVEWIALIAGVIGAMAWLPTLIPLVRPLKVEGKILSQYATIGTVAGNQQAVIMVQKLAVFARHDDFFIKNIHVFLKYNDSPEERCRLWVWRNAVFTFDENGTKIQRRLTIEPQDYLVQQVLLPKNQAVVGYLSFTSRDLRDQQYEYVKYVFTDFTGRSKELVIRNADVRGSETAFDDGIWSSIVPSK